MGARIRLAVALASLLVVSYVFAGLFLGPVLGDTTYTQLSVFNEVIRKVTDLYVEPVNVDRVMLAAEQGLTEALDGDCAYLDSDSAKLLQQPVKESDADVGVELTRRFTFLMVVATKHLSPAEKAGLRSGDILKTIDGKHTHAVSVPLGQKLLRGAPGSVVKLTILRAGSDPKDFSIVRERFAPSRPLSKVLEQGSGYLKLTEFSRDTEEATRGELEALKREGVRALALDLRGAAFGTPSEATRVAGLFQKGGVVARLKGRDFPEQTSTADPSRFSWDLPVVVLVDLGTAGPGEILAAALKDQDHPLVGEHTFGRAAVQKNLPLPEGGLLVLTVAKYVSPKGAPIHGKGLEPSVAVETDTQAEDGGKDLILEKGLELLRSVRKAA